MREAASATPGPCPAPRRPGRGARAAAALAFLGLAPAASALDLGPVRELVAEIRFTRAGQAVGPGRQVFRFLPLKSPEAHWPAVLQRREAARLRKRNRRVASWAGMLGGFPAWTLTAETLRGPRTFREIRTVHRIFAVASGGYLMDVTAEDPGRGGWERARRRAAFFLRAFRLLATDRDRDPFREIRLGEDAGRWRERYTLRVPGTGDVVVEGPPPAPRPPPPPRAPTRRLWGRTFHVSPPDHPEPFFLGEVPGYFLTGGPGFPTGEVPARLAAFLGISEGVAAVEDDPGPGELELELPELPGDEPDATPGPPGESEDVDDLLGDLDDLEALDL